MSEIDEAATMISKAVDPDANIIFGAAIDDKLVDQIKITVIATRFDESRMKLFKFQRPGQETSSIDREEKPSLEQDDDLSLYPPEVNQEAEEDRPTSPPVMAPDSDEFDIPAFLRRK